MIFIKMWNEVFVNNSISHRFPNFVRFIKSEIVKKKIGMGILRVKILKILLIETLIKKNF